MKRIIIARLRSSENITSAHLMMFHGMAFREGSQYPFSPSASWFNGMRSSLEVVHSSQLLPDIFQPAENLVVSQQVADLLKDLLRVDFLPITFDKLVDFYFEKGWKGDFSFKVVDPEMGELHGPGNYLLSLPDDPDAHKGMPKFYELLVPKDKELAEQHQDAKRTEIDLGFDSVSFKSSPEMLDENPIIRTSIYHVLSPAAFSLIEPFLDRDYYLTKELDLG